MLNIFDKYYQNYAEYCIRTTLSPDELKAAIIRELPETEDLFSLRKLKAAFGSRTAVQFSRSAADPFKLKPIEKIAGQKDNGLLGYVFIDFKTSVIANETVLQVTIKPEKNKAMCYALCIFALLFGGAASLFTLWGVVFSAVWIVMFFVVMECSRSVSEAKTDLTRRDFEKLLRHLENASC